jgi:hypothetical protein
VSSTASPSSADSRACDQGDPADPVVFREAGSWYTIYHHLPVKVVSSNPLLTNQPMGIWDIYGSEEVKMMDFSKRR